MPSPLRRRRLRPWRLLRLLPALIAVLILWTAPSNA